MQVKRGQSITVMTPNLINPTLFRTAGSVTTYIAPGNSRSIPSTAINTDIFSIVAIPFPAAVLPDVVSEEVMQKAIERARGK